MSETAVQTCPICGGAIFTEPTLWGGAICPGHAGAAHMSELYDMESYTAGFAAGLGKHHADLDAARAERDAFYMDYRMKCDEQTKALHVDLGAARAERDALYRLALTMYSGKHIQDTIDAALKEPRT